MTAREQPHTQLAADSSVIAVTSIAGELLAKIRIRISTKVHCRLLLLVLVLYHISSYVEGTKYAGMIQLCETWVSISAVKQKPCNDVRAPVCVERTVK